MEMKTIGRHIIAEFYGVSERLISRKEKVRKIIDEIVKEANLTKIGSVYKQFKPHGVTGIVLIAESHISVHTWPEYKMINIDIFTCGNPENADKAFKLFIKKFKPEKYRHHIIDRGLI
jgi:S-adenosylmethionine decarboxylase